MRTKKKKTETVEIDVNIINLAKMELFASEGGENKSVTDYINLILKDHFKSKEETLSPTIVKLFKTNPYKNL